MNSSQAASPPPILVVGAALTRPDGAVLVARRRPEKKTGGMWEFPGGKVEEGESPVEALVRELAEELGIVVAAADVGERLAVGRSMAGDRPLLLEGYRIAYDGPAPQEGPDHDAIRWVHPDQMDDLSWPPADLPIVARLQVAAGSASSARDVRAPHNPSALTPQRPHALTPSRPSALAPSRKRAKFTTLPHHDYARWHHPATTR